MVYLMVQDIRRIIFSSEELVSAFEGYARSSPRFMPLGLIRTCTPIEGEGVKVCIQMDYGSTSNLAEFVYRGADVLRPLILFCIENNIMLPRDGLKTFSISNSQAVLCVELNLDVELAMETAPMRQEHVRLIVNTPGQQPHAPRKS